MYQLCFRVDLQILQRLLFAVLVRVAGDDSRASVMIQMQVSGRSGEWGQQMLYKAWRKDEHIRSVTKLPRIRKMRFHT